MVSSQTGHCARVIDPLILHLYNWIFWYLLDVTDRVYPGQ